MIAERMTAPELLLHLRKRGVVLRPEGGRLPYDAPAGAMTPELIAAMKAQKAELLRLLSDYPPAICAMCGRDVDEGELIVWLEELYYHRGHLPPGWSIEGKPGTLGYSAERVPGAAEAALQQFGELVARAEAGELKCDGPEGTLVDWSRMVTGAAGVLRRCSQAEGGGRRAEASEVRRAVQMLFRTEAEVGRRKAEVEREAVGV